MEELLKGTAARLGDKAVGLVTYLVLFLDLLGLRSTAGKAIEAAYHVADNSILSLRVAVARIIARRLGHLMYWYAGVLFAVMVIASMLRFLTWDGKGSQPLWSYVLFVAVTMGVMAWTIWSARNQIRWGTEVVLSWHDPKTHYQYRQNPVGTWWMRRHDQDEWMQVKTVPDLDELVFVGDHWHDPDNGWQYQRDGQGRWWVLSEDQMQYDLVIVLPDLNVLVFVSNYWYDPNNGQQYQRDGQGRWWVFREDRVQWDLTIAIPDLDMLWSVHGPNDKPLRVSFYRSGIQLMTATAIMGAALFVDTIALECRWLILPQFLLFVVGIMVARVVTAVASWTVVNASRLMEATGELMAQPLAALPGLTLENLKDELFSGGRLNLFDEEEDAMRVDSVCPFITRTVLTYLILVFTTGASWRWALGLGVFLGVSQLASLPYVSDGNAEAVEHTISKRRKFLRLVYDWAPLLATLSVFGDWLWEQFMGTSVGQWCLRVWLGQVYWVENHSFWYTIPLLLFCLCVFAYFVQQAKDADWPKKWKVLGIIGSALCLALAFKAVTVRIDDKEGWTPFAPSQPVAVKVGASQASASPIPTRVIVLMAQPIQEGNGAPAIQRPSGAVRLRHAPSRYAACQTGQCGASYQKSRRGVIDLARKWGVE